ncbi:MAG: hypothetical protein QOF30_3184 [Acidimicrobiaceae bacterium]|jgi:hypothetical protein|nr:hypothetical protein [Acidimicrobiaceae bacterium]
MHLNELVDGLHGPLTDEAQLQGWSQAARDGMIGFIESLQQKLASGIPLPADEMRPLLVRGMDMWGVTSGDLLMKAALIDQLFREWRSSST